MKMARKKRRRGGKSITRTVMKLMRVGALVAPAAAVIADTGQSNQSKVYNIVYKYTGYNMADGTFDMGRIMQGWGPFIGVTLVTYGIQKLSGIIRRL